jgi:arginase family enzyme
MAEGTMGKIAPALLVILIIFSGCLQGQDYTALGIIYNMPEWCDVAAGGNLRAYKVVESGRLPNLDEVLIVNYTREAPDAVAELLGWRYERVVVMDGFTQRELYYGSWPAFAALVPEWGNPQNVTRDAIEGEIQKYRYLADPRFRALAKLIAERRPSVVIAEHHASYIALARAAKNISGGQVGAIVFDAHADTYTSENETISHGNFYEIKNSWVVGTAVVEGDVNYTLILGVRLRPKNLPPTHTVIVKRELPFVGSDIYVTTLDELKSKEKTKENVKRFFDELERRGVDSIIISIDVDVLEKNTYHGFRYNEVAPLVCMVANSYLFSTGMPIEEAYAAIDKRGATLEEVLYALKLIYKEAEKRNIKVVFQEITELNHHLDRNGETTKAAAKLAKVMAKHTSS